MLQVDIFGQDMFSDEVVVHLDVLNSSVENSVSRKMYVFVVAVVEQDWIFDGDY